MKTRPTVLVVDSDVFVRQQALEQFSRLGFQVLHADDAPQALELLSGDPHIALLVTDMVVAGMDGVRLAETARGIRPDLGVILTSAQPPVMAGTLPYLPKPWQVLELETLVGRVLAGIWKPEGGA